jgi:predicted metal-dependent phosphoesterase TrpH
MTPPSIVDAAFREGLAMIAICDHNSARNVRATQMAAPAGLCVLAGIEITTVEDVHVLGIFPSHEAACHLAEQIGDSLPWLREGVGDWGAQAVMSEAGDIVGQELRMLAASSSFDLQRTVASIRQHHGIAVAAHVDRPSFSVLSQLGIFPKDAGFDAIEVSAAGIRSGRARSLEALSLPVIASSDSHFLTDIGTVHTELEVQGMGFRELALALTGSGGRRIRHA